MDTDADTDTDTDADTGHNNLKKWGHGQGHGGDTAIKYIFMYFYLLSKLILHPQTININKN